MLDFVSDDIRRDPFPLYDRLRAVSPLLRAPGTELWMLLDHAGVKRALTDHETFSSSVHPPTGKAPDFLIFTDPPMHTKLRAIVSRAFTPRSIAALEPRIRELARELLAPGRARGELDVVTDFADPLPTAVMADLIGIPPEDRERFGRWSEGILKLSFAMVGGETAAAKIAEHAVIKEELSAYLPPLLDERRSRPRDDLLSRLVTAEVDGQHLTAAEILNFFQLLILAGTETTINTISNAVLCLLDHPEELARLRAAPELLPLAVEEVIRFRTPVQFAYREPRRDVELHGTTIPAGKLLLCVVGSANRDPAVFAEPGRFDVGRDPNPHIGFGHGIHFCLGAPLARLEARVALSALLELESFARTSDEPWTPRPGLLVHGPTRLPLRVR